MLIPLGVLAIGALFAGAAFKPQFIDGAYEAFWRQAIFFGADNHIMHDFHDVPGWVKVLPFVMMLGGLVVAIYMYLMAPGSAARLARQHPLLYRFLLNKWYFDELYDVLFVRPAFWIGRLFWKGGDGWIIDRLGPDGVSARVVDVTRSVMRLQSGYLYHYAFAMMLGIAAAITWYLVGGVH